MNAIECQLWLKQSFLAVEAALAQELLTPSRLCMTEEYLRSAFVRGLAASRPDLAHRIDTELEAPWSDNLCWTGANVRPGQGRKVQHDIAVKRPDGTADVLCEVKWLKQNKPDEIARDIWKLVLSRSNTPELASARTYLLIGGERIGTHDYFADTLRLSGAPLNWSTRKTGKLPDVKDMSLTPFLGSARGRDSLRALLRWGSVPNYRTPPECCINWRIKLRAVWLRPDGFRIFRDTPLQQPAQQAAAQAAPVAAPADNPTISWRAGLSELHRHGTGNDDCLDWNAVRAQLGVQLQPPPVAAAN